MKIIIKNRELGFHLCILLSQDYQSLIIWKYKALAVDKLGYIKGRRSFYISQFVNCRAKVSVSLLNILSWKMTAFIYNNNILTLTFLLPVDESGKRIRTNADHGPVKDYDSYVFDIYSKFVPQPVDINTCSVYDKYDILEEIGKWARVVLKNGIR